MKDYSEFFNLIEAKGVPAVFPQDIKQIQKVLKTKAGVLKGIDNKGQIIFATQKDGKDENRIITKAGSLTHPIAGDIIITKGPYEVRKYVDSFITDLNVPDGDVGTFIEQLESSIPNATLQSEFASNNGMWLFKNEKGDEFQVRAFYDKDGDLQAEVFNMKGEKLDSEEKNPKTKNQTTTNSLTNQDIQRVGGAIINSVRKDLEKQLKENLPEAFRQVAVQIIGTGKTKESQIQRKKKLIEAGITTTPSNLRVVVSFYPNKKGGDIILNLDNWNKDTAKEYIEQAKNNLLLKFRKGLVFKDPATNTNYSVALTDLNNLEVTDENGYQGYFDLAATKVIKEDSNLVKAAKWLFNKSGKLDGSGNKGLAHV